jgi:formylglycine-generating enzyme
MTRLSPGDFVMGSPPGEPGRHADEGPQRTARVHAFALGKFEITVGEFGRFVSDTGYRTEAERDAGVGCYTIGPDFKWARLAGVNWRAPGYPQSDMHPVVCVSWHDAKAYAQWLSGRTGKRYRLPSEAEWEYAARARSGSARFWGDTERATCQYANVADETPGGPSPWAERFSCRDGHFYPAPVGTYKPNAFGLHDMIGNVMEWTEDCYRKSHAQAPTVAEGRLVADCRMRVVHGGAWDSYPRTARAAFRLSYNETGRSAYIGLRLARALD